MNKAIVSRRQFLTLSGATGGAVLLAACAPVGAPSAGMDEGAADAGGGAEEMITISWSWWGSEEQLERQEAKLGAFKEANPSVDVESVFVGWREYPTKILTMYAGGTAPDAIECDAYWAPDWFSRGMAVHLDPLLDADPDASRDDYVEHFLPDMTVDGNLYGLPTDAGPMIWQYNTDVIGESGMPTPLEYYEQGEWNWDSFVELGNAVTDKEANIYFHTSFYSWAYWMPMALDIRRVDVQRRCDPMHGRFRSFHHRPPVYAGIERRSRDHASARYGLGPRSEFSQRQRGDDVRLVAATAEPGRLPRRQ